MKALVAAEYGPIESLTIVEMEKPAPSPGQVLIRVEAAALNPLDVVLVTGLARDAMPVQHPFVPGLDVAGVVESVGVGVTSVQPGDPVVAFTFGAGGSLAEYVLAAEGPGLVARPAGLNPVAAAGIPVAGMTAAALVDATGTGQGQTLLVVGATGGVGSFVVQLAAAVGASVVATGTADTVPDLQRQGAQTIIDYTVNDTTQRTRELVPDGVDAMINLIDRGDALTASAAAIKDGGVLASSVGDAGRLERGVIAKYIGVEHGIGQLARLVDLAGNGDLQVHVGVTHSFADVKDAVADFVAKPTSGKTIITF